MADDFAIQIGAALDEFNAKVTIAMQETFPEVAKEAAKTLRTVSPKRSGSHTHYATGWRQKTTQDAITIESVVYNATKPGLPHLLEHGHVTRNGGRTKPNEQIKDVETWVNEEAFNRLQRALE